MGCMYGSSVLIGPVEQAGRPVVDIAHIRIDMRPLRFDVRFVRGGRALLRVVEASLTRTVLDVRLHPGAPAEQPVAAFAMLRSMYVAPNNADVSDVQWQPAGARRSAVWQQRAPPDFRDAQVHSVQFGRSTPLRHNTTAPDLRFIRFCIQAQNKAGCRRRCRCTARQGTPTQLCV